MRFLLSGVFILLLAGCQTFKGSYDYCDAEAYPFDTPRPKAEHIVRINHDGLIIDPYIAGKNLPERATATPLPPDAVTAQFERIFTAAEELARERNSDRVKLLVHVHGGLNSFKNTDDKIRKRVPQLIMNDCEDWHYPVFVSWPTAALPTWFEHTFSIREGRKANPVWGAISAPMILTSDLLGAVSAYPDTVYYQIVNEKDKRLARGWRYHGWMSQNWKEALRKFCSDSSDTGHLECLQTLDPDQHGLQANLSETALNRGENYLNSSQHALTLPLRYTAGTLWHSTISKAAWNNMKRRAHNIFYPPQDFDYRIETGVRGGRFFEALLERVKKSTEISGLPYEITLVGHSMGTIVLNNSFNALSAEWRESDALKNIVYMAAAANIEDSLNALGPILSARNNKSDKHSIRQSPNFYNLTLNRFAEVNETHAWGLVPLGSLLVSIDQHHEDPEHPLRRTLGSELNVLASLDTISDRLEDSNGDLVFKAFDNRTRHFPQAHGDFNEIPFWRESVWQLNTDSKYGSGAPLNYSIYGNRRSVPANPLILSEKASDAP